MARAQRIGLVAACLLRSGWSQAQQEPAESSQTSKQTAPPLPKVVSASVPFYPELTGQAHIEGTVSLRVSTDGTRISTFDKETGHRLLVEAAKENLKTWQFKPHTPTKLEVTFIYRILAVQCDSECNCDSEEKESVMLSLPTSVEVSTKRVMLCDPVETQIRKSTRTH